MDQDFFIIGLVFGVGGLLFIPVMIEAITDHGRKNKYKKAHKALEDKYLGRLVDVEVDKWNVGYKKTKICAITKTYPDNYDVPPKGFYVEGDGITSSSNIFYFDEIKKYHEVEAPDIEEESEPKKGGSVPRVFKILFWIGITILWFRLVLNIDGVINFIISNWR